jgi:hypothetical protein
MHAQRELQAQAHITKSPRARFSSVSPRTIRCASYGEYDNKRIPFLLSISAELYLLANYVFWVHVFKDFAVELLGFSFSLYTRDLRSTGTET